MPWIRTQTSAKVATVTGSTQDGLTETPMLLAGRIVELLQDKARRSSAEGNATANSVGEISLTFHTQVDSS
jgi:predicted lysophospholipase L1 biosynthesis ABC-type transport system permease subunit